MSEEKKRQTEREKLEKTQQNLLAMTKRAEKAEKDIASLRAQVKNFVS
jgi:hypothetical protein